MHRPRTLTEKPGFQRWKASALGLTIDRRFDLPVSGVMKDVPANLHTHFDLLESYSTASAEYGLQTKDSWTNSNYMGYVQLTPGTDPTAFEKKLVDLSKRHFHGA